ncbi:MAG: bifunctional phosphopantothenoylcysteine decarboxylase/phosphopantothenate--cysteine ligase CoaBC [Desulfurococcales archaeon]|nr:bifunctional phosphopantothenoylcysteine decarboxylase/phosphopantothenate--cysteine ligase CoaBC [Desulfurococcales archaeon]
MLDSRNPEIWGEKSRHLQGVKIIFGITGSVAAYRAIDAMRELIKRGATVYPAATTDALRFITHDILEWATGNKPFHEFGGASQHIELGDASDVMVIAPATANTLAKIAHGIADNPVTLTALYMLGIGKPVIAVPSMHAGLWKAPQIQESIAKLRKMGIELIPPLMEGGKAKFPPNEDIVAAAEALALRGRDLSGLKFLITAGPTREWLDPVRFLSNPSSGVMGIELARNAYFRGAQVTLIHGPVTVKPPHYIEAIAVETANEMLQECLSKIEESRYDAVILAAAPSDFAFEKTSISKYPSDAEPPKLIPTPKISLKIREVFKGLLVGFAAETAENTDDLISKGTRKLRERRFDIIVANNVAGEGSPFGSVYNEVVIIKPDGSLTYVKRNLKSYIAMKILDEVSEELNK